jgi:exocyst complex component 3
LLEIVQSGLEGQEYVTVLSWIIQTYPGKELMGDPSLGIPAAKIKPLLGKETIAGLEQEYLEVKLIFQPSGVKLTTYNAKEIWKKTSL